MIGDAARRDQSSGGESATPSPGPETAGGTSAPIGTPKRPTLNASVRRRRADRAFYIRLAGTMRQNERALERLKR